MPSLPVSEGRAGLLADIRNFDKNKKLKKSNQAGERELKKKKKHKDVVDAPGKVAGGGGDLMSDLANRLRMRRKGISGGGAKPGAGASDTDTGRRPQNPLDRMSQLIPSLPPKPSADHSDLHDDDWMDS